MCALILSKHTIKNKSKEIYSIVQKGHKINQNSPVETTPELAYKLLITQVPSLGFRKDRRKSRCRESGGKFENDCALI